MSAKAIVSGALILAALGGAAARAVAQPPGPGAEQLPPPSAPATTPVPDVIPPPSQVPAMKAGLPAGTVPDPWITFDRPGCCGPIGADGPIGSEWYTRNGVSIPTGNGILRESLNTGWMTEFGGRSLFYNKATTAAWTADYSLSFTYNDAGRSDLVFGLKVPFNVTTFDQNTFQNVTTRQIGVLPMTIRDYQRASFNLAGGREWYLGTPAYCPGTHLRFGADVGGRWGTSRLELNDLAIPGVVNYRRLSDVYGAAFVSVHSDLDIPIGPCSWLIAGVRGEWNYNWSDILKDAAQPQTSDLKDVNILLTVGFRY